MVLSACDVKSDPLGGDAIPSQHRHRQVIYQNSTGDPLLEGSCERVNFRLTGTSEPPAAEPVALCSLVLHGLLLRSTRAPHLNTMAVGTQGPGALDQLSGRGSRAHQQARLRACYDWVNSLPPFLSNTPGLTEAFVLSSHD